MATAEKPVDDPSKTVLSEFTNAPPTVLAEAIRAIHPHLEEGELIRVRTVAVRNIDNGWSQAGTVLTVATPTEFPPTDQDTELGPARLLEWWYEPTQFPDKAALEKILNRWRDVVELPAETFWPDANHPLPARAPKGNGWHDSPIWSVGLRSGSRGTVARGPFVNIRERMFAHDLGDVTDLWLRIPARYQERDFGPDSWIILPDRRAYFRSLVADGYELEVHTAGFLKGPLYCCGTSETALGVVKHHFVDVRDERATLHFDGPIEALDLYLVAEGMPWLDRYYEDADRASWRTSIYSSHRALWDEDYADLERVRDEGEGQTIEFKAGIAVRRRDNKSSELLEVVSAFANSGGGNVYIGVDDTARVVGIERHLKRDYGQETRGDTEAMVAAYVADLKRFVSEGVTPEIRPRFTPIDFAGLLVLRIAVSGQEGVAHVLAENDVVFVRRGATNRRAKPAEVSALEGRRAR